MGDHRYRCDACDIECRVYNSCGGLHEKLETGDGTRTQPLGIFGFICCMDVQDWECVVCVGRPGSGRRKCPICHGKRKIPADLPFDPKSKTDPFDKRIWTKANPNMGYSVDFSKYHKHINRALKSSIYRNTTLRYYGNVMVSCSEQLIAPQMAQHLINKHGQNCTRFSQTPSWYNPGVRELMRALRRGDVSRGGDPVMAWQADNLIVVRDARDLWMPDKSHKEKKIDLMVSVLMAISDCMFHAAEDDGRRSVYETRGLRTI